MKRWRGWSSVRSPGLTVLVLAALVCVPLGLLVAVRLGSANSLPGATFDAAPVIVSATARKVTGQQPVTVVPAWQPGPTLYAPAWHGLVTAVALAAGTKLKSGDPVATIDGVQRIALQTPQPFYRPIPVGATGSDVAALNQALLTLGFLDPLPSDSTSATYSTGQAVRALSEKLGVTPPTTTFDPGWVVWLPEATFAVQQVSITPGQEAPAQGSALAIGQARLVSAPITSSNQDSLHLDPTVNWVLLINGRTFSVDATKLAVSPDALSSLAAALPQPSASPSNPGQAAGPQPSGVAAFVQRASALDAAAVPSTAIMTGSDGSLCVWIPSNNGYAVRKVTVSDAQAGVTDVISGISAGAILLANPGQALKDPQCP